MKLLQPFQPSAADPWDLAKVAHLARRAGFGASGETLNRLFQLGPDGAVDHFVEFASVDGRLEAELEAVGPELELIPENKGAYGADSMNRLRRWWLYRMVRSHQPLQEKLALFWHDHFACQESKVIRTNLLLNQNILFRDYGAGSFRELLRRVSRDPAMLVFLDNRLSEKGSPNENWARELLELFTVGVDRYSQHDITELARVFTGWTTRAGHVDKFVFDPTMHDHGDKLVFGHKIRGRAGADGLDEGNEALDIILERADCASYLASKLVAWFITQEPSPEAVADLAGVLRESDYSIREALRTLFRSKWFYSEEHRFRLHKTPVELIAGAARALELQNPHLAELEKHCLRMGMKLFEPPSVAGWEHGQAWVRTGSVAPRLNFALALSEVAHAGRKVAGRASLDLDELRGHSNAPDEDRELVRSLAERLLQRPLSTAQRDAIADVLDTSEPVSDDPKVARKQARARVRAAIHLVLSSPQFALA
jgi:hypothetical protein